MPEGSAVQRMFSGIASRYDFANRVLSLGLCVGWRERLVAAAQAAIALKAKRLVFMSDVPGLMRDLGLVLVSLLSLRLTPAQVHADNQFGWAPMAEVAKLFAGIFLTIIPVIAMLKAGKVVALDSTRRLLEKSPGLVLKLRLDREVLPEGLAAEVLAWLEQAGGVPAMQGPCQTRHGPVRGVGHRCGCEEQELLGAGDLRSIHQRSSERKWVRLGMTQHGIAAVEAWSHGRLLGLAMPTPGSP